jgi:hypothetical protein
MVTRARAHALDVAALEAAPLSGASGTGRSVPLIVVALAKRADSPPAEFVRELHEAGAVVYATHGSAGCLRVATAVGPDRIYLDPRLPSRLLDQLRAHPATARVRIGSLPPPRTRQDAAADQQRTRSDDAVRARAS